MEANRRYTAFGGFTRIAAGDLAAVLSQVWQRRSGDSQEGARDPVLIFDDQTGEQVDFDLSGTLEEVLARVAPAAEKKGPGRPSLGVTCREVCLLPRHWEWLEGQPARASGTIRRLVESALKSNTREDRHRRKLEAVGRVMWSLTGNLEGFEEASRALYAGDWSTFDRSIAAWPEDIRKHLADQLGAEQLGAEQPGGEQPGRARDPEG